MDADMAALLLLYFYLAVVQAGPRVCGVRGPRDGTSLLSPCPVQASMIAHFPLENEDLAGALPASSSREGQMALQLCTGAHRAPRLSRGHREALLLTAAGRGALLLCGTAGSTSGSEIPPESG